MEDTEKQINQLRKDYGFSKGSYKYILPGSEIFKYVGQIIYRIYFEKDESGEWKTTMSPAIITKVNEFNGATMTYKINYVLNTNPEEELVEEIIPEGFSFGNPEETGKMIKFTPRSIHNQLVEDEFFYTERLKELYKDNALNIDELKTISESKNQDEILRYSHNVGICVLNSTTIDEYFYIRAHKIKITHKGGSKYELFVADNNKNWNFIIDSSDTEFDFNIPNLKFKIISLAK